MRFNPKVAVRIAIPIVLVGLVVLLVSWPRGDAHNAAAGGDWTCSMHPQIRQPRPGKCPICGMDLVPVSQLSDQQAKLNERAGIETEAVTYRELFKEIRTVGKIDYNERQIAYIAARIAGRVDRVYADFTGIQVKKDDHLVDIYSPDLFIAQDELIRAVDAAGKGNSGFDASFAKSSLEAARTKLRLLGILQEQIQEIEMTKKVRTHLTIYAPIGGTVIEKGIRAGQYVKEGDMLYRIADLDPVWLYLDIYEYDLAWVRFGQKVAVTVEAYPGETFKGIVTFIDPFLQEQTRTVKVRVNLPNSEKKLRPGMYASVAIQVRLRSDGTPEPTGLEGKYICPMHPEVIRDKPGKCPICEMALERVPEIQPLQRAEPAGHAEQAEHQHVDPKKGEKVQPTSNEKKSASQSDALTTPDGKVLAVRLGAVLDTGKRKVVYRPNKDGAYEMVELEVGPRAEGKDDSGRTVAYYPVRKGLQPEDLVVVRGGFLLDSQRQIEGMPSLLFPQGQAGVNLHSGHAMPPQTKQHEKH